MKREITIRVAKLNDVSALQALFVETVSSICKTDYDAQQIKVWTASVENEKRWHEIMTTQVVLIAQKEDKIVGFATLENSNYIDLLYVHKDYQRQGIAQKLYNAIEEMAKYQSVLIADVSKTAKPFFEKMGFEINFEQTVQVRGVEFGNYKMTKQLERI